MKILIEVLDNKIVTSNDRNLVTSKKPGTVLLMQNVDLGHTKVIQIRQRETLSHHGAIIHESCCSSAQYFPVKMTLWKKSSCWVKVKKNISVSSSISRQLWTILFCFEILGAPLDSTYRMNFSWHVHYFSIFVLFWILLMFA